MNSDASAQPGAAPLRYPALLVIGCALGMCVSIAPVYLSSFAVFLLPISQEFGWSRGDMSMLFSTTALAIAVASPVVGVLMKRIGARRVLMIGITTFAISILTVSRISDSFPAYLFLSAVLGLTGAATNTFVYVTILPQWFSDRLGLMMGLAMTGIGIGQTISPILTQALITEFGWRNAYIALAALPLAIALPSVLFLIKERFPLDDPQDPGAKDQPVGAFDVLQSTAFWQLGISFLVISVAVSGIGLHTVAILVDRGLTPMEAASIAATSGVAVFFGRLAAGALLDHVGPRAVGLAVFLAAALGAALLTTHGPTPLLVLVPAMVGLALGAEGDLMPFSIRKRFGLQNYSVIYGWLFLLFNVGVFLGPVLMGAYYDLTAGYDGMLLGISVAVLLSYAAFWRGIGK